MKFNEKLIELRKREGLSQEELGYKLNVTRQTVSKWELGQTTPEMDKLVELRKIFNISVDDLLNEVEITSTQKTTIDDQPINEKETKNNKIVLIIVGIIVVIAICIIVKLVTAFTVVDKVAGSQGNIFDRIFSVMDKQDEMVDNVTDLQGNIFDRVFSAMDKQDEMFENSTNKLNVTSFNGTLELYNGSNVGISLKELLDEVITINKKGEREITVKYMETKTQDPEEIKNLKLSFSDTSNFEVTFEYDEEGYIDKVVIEKVISQFEISRFNNALELYNGSNNGMTLKNILDEVVTINKTEDRKITVKYMETETQDSEEIKNMKKGIETFDNYEVTFEYDADGFINKAIIEKL